MKPTDKERLDFLESQLRFGWGDGFASQRLDSGGVYVRPWRKELMQKWPGDAWYPTLRDCIDAAIAKQGNGGGPSDG